jgi:hypothetical protein
MTTKPLRLFNAVFERKSGAVTEIPLYGRDRDDVMTFIKKHFRTVLGKITSCALSRAAPAPLPSGSDWADWPPDDRAIGQRVVMQAYVEPPFPSGPMPTSVERG